MGDLANEPSMEEILSSIKRIIAEEGEGAVAARTRTAARKPKAAPPVAEVDEVLELTETVAELRAPAAAATASASDLVSHDAALASRERLAALSALVMKPEAPGNTLEGLVREMLRPMLKEWLDAHLPELVERIVAREVARITDRGH